MTRSNSASFDEQRLEILRAALTAPSGDNCQPWCFELTPDGFDVVFDRPRARALLDPGDVASRLAAGALMEAARLEALRRGYALEVHWSDSLADDRWARVRLLPAPPQVDELAAELATRETNRLRFDRSALSEEEQQGLLAEVQSPVHLSFFTERKDLDTLAGWAGTAERIRAQTQRSHEEFHGWLRWSPEAVQQGDGLDVDTLGVGPMERALLSLTRPWSRMRWFLSVLPRLNGDYSARLAKSSSALGVLWVAAPSDVAAAGQVVLRLWLRATRLGLAFSPLAALPLLVLRARNDLEHDLAPARAAELHALGAALQAHCAVGDGRLPVFMFRVGRAPRMKVRALRRPLEALLRCPA